MLGKTSPKQEVFILGGENEEHMQFWENLIVPFESTKSKTHE